MSNIRETAALYGLSLVPQASYSQALVPTTSPKNFEQLVKEGFDFANYQTNTIDDEGQSTGSDHSENEYLLAHDVEVSFTERVSSQRAARRCLGGFGSVVTANLGGTAYSHIFSLLDPAAVANLPQWAYVEKAGQKALASVLHDVFYPSLSLEQLGFTGDGISFLEMTSQFRGSGKRAPREYDDDSGVSAWAGTTSYSDTDEVKVEDLDGVVKVFTADGGHTSGASFDATERLNWHQSGALKPRADTPDFVDSVAGHVVLFKDQVNNYFRRTQGVVDLYPQEALGGSPVNIRCDFRSFNINLNNNVQGDIGYCADVQDPGDGESGAIRNSLPVGKQEVTVEVTLLVDPTLNNVQTDMMTKKVISLDLMFEGAAIGATAFNHRLQFLVNKATFETVSLTQVDNLLAWSIALKPLASGNVLPLQAVVYNEDSDLTAL